MKLIMESWKRYLSEASIDWKSLDPKNPEHYQAIFNLKADPMSPDFAKVKKISNLKIKSDDCVNLIGKINKVNFSINLNYFSIFPKREIYVDGKNFSLQADLINNSIKYFQNGKIKNIKLDVDKNFPYQMQHSSILNGNFKTSSSYKNAKGIMFLIDKIRNQNK